MNVNEDDDAVVAICATIITATSVELHRIIKRRVQKRRKRRFWIHPSFANRRNESEYFTYFERHCLHDAEKFYSYVRMTPQLFDKLFSLLKDGLTRNGPREPISPKERLVVILRFLGHGSTLTVLSTAFRLGKQTLSRIVSDTCLLIWTLLRPIVIKTPNTPDEWIAVADGFFTKSQLPNCIGAIDGKHFRIQAPPNSGSLFFCHHQFFSIVMLAVCDADYHLLYVDIGSYGHNNDAGIFATSKLGQKLDKAEMNLPPRASLPGTNVYLPYFLVGDEIFPLKSYLFKPFPGRGLTRPHRIFNYRLSRARRIIENVFGIMSSKWRLLRTCVIASEPNACLYLKTICCLHNFLRIENDSQYFQISTINDDGVFIGAPPPLPQAAPMRRASDNHPAADAILFREQLSEYVNGIGAVPWQANYHG